MGKYFCWQPERSPRFVRISSPPVDNEGQYLDLSEAGDIRDDLIANFSVEKVKVAPDFIYDVGLLLLISERAWAVISEFDVQGVRPHQAFLRAPDGALMVSIKWVQLKLWADLLDRERSIFEPIGLVGLRVHKFVVREGVHSGADLFYETSTAGHIFSERLVSRIQQEKLSGEVFTPLEDVKTFFKAAGTRVVEIAYPVY